MNIAILIPELGGGGAERVAQLIGDYYVDKGNNVYYFLGNKSVKQAYPVKGKIIYTGIKSYRSESAFGDIWLLCNLVKSSFQMRKWKHKYKIDAAISFMEEYNYINVLSKGREKVITRICIVLSQASQFSGLLYKRNIINFFYNKADKVVVLCDYAKADMHRNYGIAIKKMVKIPNPVLKINAYDEKSEWKYGNKVFITVGRLAEQKQQDRIIRAFSYVNQQEQGAKLLILGVGPREGYLKHIIGKYGLEDKVILAGFKSDVTYYLAHSRVFVLASRVEGMPNCILEAMSCGLPVVSTDSPGACGELLGKKKILEPCKDIQYCPYGILTPHIRGDVRWDDKLTGEERLLGKAMLELLNNDNLHQEYRKRSYKRAAMYNIDKIMNKWNKLW